MKLTYDDRQHAYWLDGRRCKSVTSVAKIPDNTFNLEQWRKRQILLGVAQQPELVERVAAHWDDKAQLDKIGEEAMAAAKAHTAAGRGTAAHRITERIDLNELIIDTPQSRAVQAAWQKALDLADIEIVPEYVERILVWPDRMIAGRADRFVRRRSDRKLCVLDLKTGSSAINYPHSTAIQLWLYANAPLMAGPVPRDGGSTTKFETMADLDVDTTVGYVVHMPTDGEVQVVAVDLAKAAAGAQCCFDVIAWRDTAGLMFGIDAVVNVNRDRWIGERLKTIAALGPQAKADVIASWPQNVPAKPPWSAADIEFLDLVLAGVEAKYEMAFTVDPTRDVLAERQSRKER